MLHSSLLPPTSWSKRSKNNVKMEAGRFCEISVIITNRNCAISQKSWIFNTANRISNLAYKSVLTFKHVTIIIKDKYNSHALRELTVILLLSLIGILTATLPVYLLRVNNKSRQTTFSVTALRSCVKTLRLVSNEEINLKLCTNSIQ